MDFFISNDEDKEEDDGDDDDNSQLLSLLSYYSTCFSYAGFMVYYLCLMERIRLEKLSNLLNVSY